MESSNAGVDVVNNEKLNQPVMSPVPDLVTNIPTSTTSAPTPTNVPTTTTNPAAKTDPLASKASAGTIDASTQPSPEVKPTPAVAVKTIPTQTPTNSTQPRATSLPSAASEASVKNRSSREEKTRKKDDKSVDHVLRALNSLNTTEEKLAAMCKKYADIFDEHRKTQLLNKQTEKRCSMLQREKEQLQAEHSKAILTRSRLENLCRELQRQNKAIKDESLLKIREEEEKRKEITAKFQTTMNEITTMMQQNNDKNMKLRDDNVDMSTKLKSICDQYELRQQQVERISKQMQLEQQLADAKLSKLKMEMAAEREMLLREKQQLLMEIQQYQQRCTEFQATEVNLRNQISMYNDKYDEFQKALARSNDVFGGFKGEMEKMSKKICKLEKETSSWKQRWERSHNALLEMAADKQKSEQELAVVSRQLATLQNLCRTLQTERSNLLAKLKVFQTGGHEPLEKCNKQCDQPVNHMDQPLNHVMDSNPVLQHYSQDILASFKESVDDKDTPIAESIVTVCAEIPVPASPLPDVVGATSACVVDQKPDVNSAFCERLENLALDFSVSATQETGSVIDDVPTQPNVESNVSVIQEISNDDQNVIQSNLMVDVLMEQENLSVNNIVLAQPNTVGLELNVPVIQEQSSVDNTVLAQPNTVNIESNVPVIQEQSNVDQPNVDVTVSHQSVIVENLTPQLVLNGDVHTTGSPPAELNSQPDLSLNSPQFQPPKSLTAKGSPTKSADGGKKAKETAKKKKK